MTIYNDVEYQGYHKTYPISYDTCNDVKFLSPNDDLVAVRSIKLEDSDGHKDSILCSLFGHEECSWMSFSITKGEPAYEPMGGSGVCIGSSLQFPS